MALKTILPKADILPQEWLRNSGTEDFYTYIDDDPDEVGALHLKTNAPLVEGTREANFSFRDAFQEASFGGATSIQLKARVSYQDAGGGDPTSAAIKFSYLINGVVQGTVEFDTPIEGFNVGDHTFSGLTLEQSEINSMDIRFEDGTIVDSPIGGVILKVHSVRVFVTHSIVSPTEKTITPLTPTEKTITATACTEKTISRAQVSESTTINKVPIADGAELDWTPGSGGDHYTEIDQGVEVGGGGTVLTTTSGHQDRWEIAAPPTDTTLITALDFLHNGSLTPVAAVASYKFEYLRNNVIEATFTSADFSTQQIWSPPGHADTVTGLSIVPADGDTHEVRVTLNYVGVVVLMIIEQFDLRYNYNHLVNTPRTEKTISTTACTEKTITALTPTEKVI